MPLTDYQREFLQRLADLCDEYHAGFLYTAADNGTRITMDGEEVFVGFLADDAAEQLRAASGL